jgi:predicted RNA methylase
MTNSLFELSKELEHYETPRWAVDAILNREIMPRVILDPCCGTGVLSDAARAAGYVVASTDIHDWGYPGTIVKDFLTMERNDNDGRFAVLMNPPFSKAVEFVEKAFALGAFKVVCFQRFSWWESRKRRDFWKKYPPSDVYVCGDRADCWRHDIPHDQRTSSTPTAHAWFVFVRDNTSGTRLDHIYKGESCH